MEIDYKDMRTLLELRIKQIDQAALELHDANVEYQNLVVINKCIGQILCAYKKPFPDTPAVGEVEKQV